MNDEKLIMFTVGWMGGSLIGALDLSMLMWFILVPVFYIIGRIISNL